ncbi:MAG: threonine synthase [Vicinamibacteria bacterium]|nr:threonine synthase [Vicinamibacteria bacterium]
MKFISTNGLAKAVDLQSALLAGLAPDSGLYLPEEMEALPQGTFDSCETLPQTARLLLNRFFVGDPLVMDLGEICDESLNLETPMVLIAKDTHVLELFHGPTAAFKDYGARFLANTLGRMRVPGSSARPLTILVATSGDTGSAVAAAFHRRPGFRVVILYPEAGVSKRQAHQLGCFGDNILTLRVPSGFDRCQALVKQAFADVALRDLVPLSSANSISLGRLLPQTTYYAFASLQHFRATAKPLSFIVPTGNLGNGVAALMARRMGLPIDRVLFATNHNRTVPEFIETGDYRARPSVRTLANAMDVGDPSNVARLRFMMAEDPTLRGAVAAVSVDDETIRARIHEGETKYQRIFCPHTACAVEVLERERRAGSDAALCVVATAHPAKFEEVVEPVAGHVVAPPPSLRDMLARPSMSEPLEPDYASLKERLLRL